LAEALRAKETLWCDRAVGPASLARHNRRPNTPGKRLVDRGQGTSLRMVRAYEIVE
jgi:hypothetical protein